MFDQYACSDLQQYFTGLSKNKIRINQPLYLTYTNNSISSKAHITCTSKRANSVRASSIRVAIICIQGTLVNV
jgi:hypothetical protein